MISSQKASVIDPDDGGSPRSRLLETSRDGVDQYLLKSSYKKRSTELPEEDAPQPSPSARKLRELKERRAKHIKFEEQNNPKVKGKKVNV